MTSPGGRGARRLVEVVVAVAILAAATAVTGVGAGAEPAPPAPVVTGPVEGGSRTGEPWLATPFDLGPFGYVEEEFFLSGTASNRGHSSDGVPNVEPSPVAVTTAPYRVRMLVRRPADATRFNGTAVVEWANVSNQMDFEATWGESHSYLIERGYVSVMLSAQKAGVDQPPGGMRYWDPVRYETLHHPGDDYSYDIFTQAARALRSPGPDSVDPLSGLRPERIIGTGASQSCFRLINYVNLFAEEDAAYDGFNPSVCMTNSRGIRTDVVPIMWVNTETELATQGDGGLLRLWEVAGASHLGWYAFRFGATAAFRDLTSGPAGLDAQAFAARLSGLVPAEAAAAAAALGPWDEATAGSYGEHGEGGPCPQNLFPTRFAYNAALDHLNRWLVDGTAPPAAERFPRTEMPTRADRGDALNVLGGVRLPPIDVPIATYLTDTPCILVGSTVPFDPVSLRQRYPTLQDYLCAFDAATTAAVSRGFLLDDDGDELRARATASTLWGDDAGDMALCRAPTRAAPANHGSEDTPAAPTDASDPSADRTSLPATGGGAPIIWAALLVLTGLAGRIALRGRS